MIVTKADLIKALQDDPTPMDAPVRIVYDYGDRNHTSVAAEIKLVEETPIRHSEYHRSDVVVDDEGDLRNENPQYACCLFASGA